MTLGELSARQVRTLTGGLIEEAVDVRLNALLGPGVYDTVSPPRVVSHVWNRYMMTKPGRNALYFVPEANHYLQNDRPDELVEVLLHALDAPEGAEPGALAARPGAPLLVDRSRAQLPSSTDLLTQPA